MTTSNSFSYPLSLHDALPILLPVWVLLQPRDYINGVQLFIGLILLYGSVLLAALFSATKPDRKSTRLNSSHVAISYAIFCLKKKSTRTYIRVGLINVITSNSK